MKEMKNPTIKEYLGKSVWYDEQGQMIFSTTPKGDRHVADIDFEGISVRGWGSIQYMFDSPDDAIKFQDDVGRFVAEAINEKLNK